MNVAFYLNEWQADDSMCAGGGAYKDNLLYSNELDVLPTKGMTLYHSVVKIGQGLHKTKYRVLEVDWSVMTIDGQHSNEVQVRLVKA